MARLPQAGSRVWVVVAILLAAALAWSQRFVQDDAYISFRYAANLAAGHGLVFNPGERVEGYTNLLWTLLVSIPMMADADPVLWAYLAGMASFLSTLAIAYLLAVRVLKDRGAALLALAFLGTNRTFHSYATGGLETPLHALLVVASLYVGWRAFPEDGGPVRPRFLAYGSGLLGFAFLARPDTGILAAVFGIAALVLLGRREASASRRVAGVAAAALPVAAILAGWVAWKLSFYGEVLPNTFFAKVSSGANLARGAYYVYLFFFSYWLVPFPLLLAATFRQWLGRAQPAITFLVAAIAAWLAWMVYVGGDFMEFRFLVPILPFLAIVLAWQVTSVRVRELRWALAALVLAGSAHHAVSFGKSTFANEVATFAELKEQVDGQRDGWVQVGRDLRRMLPPDAPGEPVRIATLPSGAIPYFSGLPTVDMLGLADPQVAREGRPRPWAKPGHQRVATTEYLLQRGVNLVIGHPLLVPPGQPLPAEYTRRDLQPVFSDMLYASDPIPQDAAVLEIPLSDGRRLVALYLVPSPRVDQAIALHGWVRHALLPG